MSGIATASRSCIIAVADIVKHGFDSQYLVTQRELHFTKRDFIKSRNGFDLKILAGAE